MPSISSFEIPNFVIPEPKNFFRIPASADDAAGVNPNSIKYI